MFRFVLHPLLFYPLALLLAGLIIAVGIQPQKWPRPPAPVAGAVADGALVLTRDAFDAPDVDAAQNLTVTRDFLGRAQTLRLAVLPDQPAPGPSDSGARILLAPDAATRLEGLPVTVEVTYKPLPLNAASALAVSLQGANGAQWATQTLPPQAARIRFQLPQQTAVNAIGLRAISNQTDQSYGLEITEIRVLPRG